MGGRVASYFWYDVSAPGKFHIGRVGRGGTPVAFLWSTSASMDTAGHMPRSQFVIEGGRPISGTLEARGNKNAALLVGAR